MTRNDALRCDRCGAFHSDNVPCPPSAAATHTPRPWTCKPTDDGAYALNPSGVGWLQCSKDETWANARLIAAAPELLAALKLVRPVIEERTQVWLAEALRERNEETEGKMDGAVSFLETVDAAIEKAEGR